MSYDLEKDKLYTITTKYPYVLNAIIEEVKLVAVVYNWRILPAKIGDVLTEYTRIKQMDNTLPPIDDMVFYILQKQDSSKKLYVIAKDYIEDSTDFNSY